MSKRPLSVSFTGWLYIAVGCGSLAKLFGRGANPAENGGGLDSLFVATSAVLAIVGGAFLFRASNWARWLCVVWMAAHVVISLRHSLGQTVVHAVFLAIIAYFLFRPPASAYFRHP